MLWYGARLIGAGRLDDRPADRLPALPRPVLLPAAAAVGRVRPVDPGPGLARPPRRAAGHADVDAGAGARRRSGRVASATCSSRACASPTRPTRRRRCAASTCDITPGRERRPRRHDRRRQVDVRQARRPLLRPDRRAGARRRRRPARPRPARASAATSATCRRSRSCSRARSARTSPTAAPTPPTSRSSAAARAVGAHDLVGVDARRLPHAGRRDRPLAVGRPAPAAVPGPGRS